MGIVPGGVQPAVPVDVFIVKPEDTGQQRGFVGENKYMPALLACFLQIVNKPLPLSSSRVESLRSTFLPVLLGCVKNNKMTIIKIKGVITDLFTPVILNR